MHFMKQDLFYTSWLNAWFMKLHEKEEITSAGLTKFVLNLSAFYRI